MELTTVVLNINKGFNEQLMRTCQTLSEYTDLVARIRSYQKDMSFEEAATRAIDECISEGILEDFLRKNRREAIRVSVLECKVEDVIDILQKDAKEDGFAEGHANGLAVGHAEGLAKGLAEGLAEGKAEGLAEGKAEGLAEGKAEGLAEGLVEGKAEGKTQNQLSSIHAIMKNLNMNLTQAMDALNIPEQERKALIDQLNV